MVKEIKLGGERARGRVTLVDEDDYAKFSKFNWHTSANGYAIRFTKKNGVKTVHILHRDILNTPKHLITDHINGDRLDNRKENLRIATSIQNSWNQGGRLNKTSKYKGVCWNKEKKKWVAGIKKNYKQISLGYFDNEHDAARMYNFWAVDMFGEFARLNIIEEELTHD